MKKKKSMFKTSDKILRNGTKVFIGGIDSVFQETVKEGKRVLKPKKKK